MMWEELSDEVVLPRAQLASHMRARAKTACTELERICTKALLQVGGYA